MAQSDVDFELGKTRQKHDRILLCELTPLRWLGMNLHLLKALNIQGNDSQCMCYLAAVVNYKKFIKIDWLKLKTLCQNAFPIANEKKDAYKYEREERRQDERYDKEVKCR